MVDRVLPPFRQFASEVEGSKDTSSVSASTAAEQPPVDSDVAWDRTETINEDVAVAVFGEVRRQLEFEHGIRGKLERKAQSTLSVSGLAITLASGLGVNVALNDRLPTLLPSWTHVPLALAFLASLGIGVASGLFALRAFRADKDIRQARYEDVFSEGALKGKTEWHRWMAVHVFSVAEEQHKFNEIRAALVKRAMRLFFAYLLVIAILGLLAGTIMLAS